MVQKENVSSALAIRSKHCHLSQSHSRQLCRFKLKPMKVAPGATWWSNLPPIQVAPSGVQAVLASHDGQNLVVAVILKCKDRSTESRRSQELTIY